MTSDLSPVPSTSRDLVSARGPGNEAPGSDVGTADGVLGLTGSAQWLARYEQSLLGVFGPPQRVLVRGNACTVWDADGNSYLDLLGGIAVNVLGHANPFVTSVISSQLATLGHISNFFTSPPQIALAERLLALADAPAGSKVFFSNSGTEAVEAAFKLARAAGNHASPRRETIVALERGFHGRSMGALALTHKAAYREPFEPLPAGVVHVPAGDVDALRTAVDQGAAAVFLEPIQGEAGVHELPVDYLRTARQITRDAGALMIVDEVQTGVGRTGDWFALRGMADDVRPDAITLAKGLGAGFPIGALITFGPEVSALLGPGQHGTTFGGNPVACAAALATLHTIEAEDLLTHANDVGTALRTALAGVDGVVEVRGRGLLVGFDLAETYDAPAVVRAALDAGFIINAPGPHTLRLAPPLVLTTGEANEFVAALPEILRASVAASEPTNEPEEGTE